MPLEHGMYWTGVATWTILALIGLFEVTDRLAEWFIESARFKAYVVGYWKQRRPDRATVIDEFVQNSEKK